MAEEAGADGSANLGFPIGRFRLGLAVASFLLMEAGNLRSGGPQFLRDRIFEAGFILGLAWFGIAFSQIVGRMARRRRSRTVLRDGFQRS